MKTGGMRIAVIGGTGSREDALAWKLMQSPRVKEIFVYPGNAKTAVIPIDLTDIRAQIRAFQEHCIDLVVVGPEALLDLGIVDACQIAGIPIFGPTQAAAQIETDKGFAQELMKAYGIPHARGPVFSTFAGAVRYFDSPQTFSVAVKPAGLTAGKGVTMARSKGEALEVLQNIMVKRVFGNAGNRVVIQEGLSGREVSLLAFTDGKTVVPMVPACDYKRRDDGNYGPQTGGMGSYSSPGILSSEMLGQITETILIPTVQAMAKEGRPYKGVLYAGLMLTSDGPKVLEFNVRFGDPETQVILPRLETDLVEIMLAVINGTLDQIKIEWSDEACVGVVIAAPNYPESPSKGALITGLDRLAPGILVFHGGTKTSKNGGTLTDGGRILTIVAKGDTLLEAREKAYKNLPLIKIEGGSRYRGDIADIPVQLAMRV